jgi:hypothetical protein
MTDKNDYKRQAQSQGQKPEKQSGWEAKFCRKGSCEKMNFKFLFEIEK